MPKFWTAKHTHDENGETVKRGKDLASASLPKLKERIALKVKKGKAPAGTYAVARVDIGKTGIDKLCKVFERAGFAEKTDSEVMVTVDAEGEIKTKKKTKEE